MVTWFLGGELPLPTGFTCHIETKREEICSENTTSKPLINRRQRQQPMAPSPPLARTVRPILEIITHSRDANRALGPSRRSDRTAHRRRRWPAHIELDRSRPVRKLPNHQLQAVPRDRFRLAHLPHQRHQHIIPRHKRDQRTDVLLQGVGRQFGGRGRLVSGGGRQGGEQPPSSCIARTMAVADRSIDDGDRRRRDMRTDRAQREEEGRADRPRIHGLPQMRRRGPASSDQLPQMQRVHPRT